EEAVAPERPRERGGRIRVADGEPVACAAGEADEPFVPLLEEAPVEARRQRLAALLRPRVRVRRREQPAEVGISLRRLDEERDVGACIRSGAGRAGTCALGPLRR